MFYSPTDKNKHKKTARKNRAALINQLKLKMKNKMGLSQI
jgi:hypothetical protein